MTTDQYFAGEETNRRRELVFGMVHEPPSPFPFHQALVVALTSALHTHVTAEGSGAVYVSPLDLVLDADRALILQPDILFIAHGNAAIVDDRVVGAPDLVIEVLSAGTRYRDRTAKRHWYLHYGVREYWLVDPRDRIVEVATGPSTSLFYRPGDRLHSDVLPRFAPAIEDIFSNEPA